MSEPAMPYTLAEPLTTTHTSTPPTGFDVAAFLGSPDDIELAELAASHVEIVTAMAHAYVRGNGFTDVAVANDIAAVIITATARLVANPEQISQAFGPVVVRGGFTGWNLAESFVLNSYRGRAV